MSSKLSSVDDSGSEAAIGDSRNDQQTKHSSMHNINEEDVVMQLILDARKCRFKKCNEFSTGRFLDDWDEQGRMLRKMDLGGLQFERRGEDWIRMKGSFKEWTEESKYAYVELRLEKVGDRDQWKIENLRVIPDPEAGPRELTSDPDPNGLNEQKKGAL